MARDNSRKLIIPERFRELKTLQNLDEPFKDLYFRNDDGTIARSPNGDPLRKDRQTDIAFMFGISPVTLSRQAGGKQSPHKETLELFKKHYGINPLWLTGGSDVKTLGNLVIKIIDRSKKLDSILQELLAINGIDCQEANPTGTIGGIGYSLYGSDGRNVNGRYLTADEFHALAVKVSDFLKFEIDHWK